MTTINVSSGHTSSGVTLGAGVVMIVSAGGSAINTVVNSGGLLEIEGTTTGTVLNSGGTEGVFELTTAGDTMVNLGGMIDLYYIGPALGVSASLNSSTDELTIYQSRTTIWQQQLSGNYANTHIQVTSDSLNALDGGEGTLLTLVPGPATVSSGSTYNVSAGQTAIGTVLYGTQTVQAGGTADSSTVSSGGVENVLSGGVADSTTVWYGGVQDVDGGSVSATAINSGVEVVGSGGTAISTTVYSGTLTVASGGATTGSDLGAESFEYVQSGGTASATTIGSQGVEYLYPGAIANGVTVDYGGTLIMAGTSATGIVDSAGGNVYSGSEDVVSSGQVRSGTPLNLADIEYVSSGGQARGDRYKWRPDGRVFLWDGQRYDVDRL